MKKFPSNITVLGPTGSYLMFGPDGDNMTPIQAYRLAPGTKVLGVGGGCAEYWYVVIDDNMNIVEIAPAYYEPGTLDRLDVSDRYFSIRKKLSAEDVRPISERFGIGFYFDESGELVPQRVIARSLQRADEADALIKELARQEAKEKAEMRERLIKEYHYLKQIADNAPRSNVVGQNIRTELKTRFPGIKFSVRCVNDTYHISWTDGPKQEEVDGVVLKYKDHHLDYTGDYMDYSPSVFNNLFGGIPYIRTSRVISDEVLSAVAEQYKDLTEENKHTYKDDAVRRVLWDCRSLSVKHIIETIAHQESYLPHHNTKPTATSGSVKVCDYIAITGNTKPIKEELKAMGATFNPKLPCGVSWILPAGKKDEVLALSKEVSSLDVIALLGDTKALRHELKAMGALYCPYLADGAGWIVMPDKREEIEQLIR